MLTQPKPVGSLACQIDSYLKELEATVITCDVVEKPPEGVVSAPLAAGQTWYEVVLSDTVLFPTGGSQPHDLGTIANIPVISTYRRGLTCIHLVQTPVDSPGTLPFKIGDAVILNVDWTRRWDHMTQHSGQHLLSAIAESDEFELPTIGWNLGISKCYIEIDLTKRKQAPAHEDLLRLEKRVNEAIRKRIPVSVAATENSGAEKLPDGLENGLVRYITIEGVDRNPCCGTHVMNTAELQCFKILGTEKVRGNNIRVFFVFGDRVLNLMEEGLARDRQLKALLSTGPDTYVEKVAQMSSQLKDLFRDKKNLTKELAELTAVEFLTPIQVESTETARVVGHFRPEGDAEYLTHLTKALQEKSTTSTNTSPITLILCAGDPASSSACVNVVGYRGAPVPAVEGTWKLFAAAMGGNMKGGGKGGRYQGKVTSWKTLSDAMKAAGAEFNLRA